MESLVERGWELAHFLSFCWVNELHLLLRRRWPVRQICSHWTIKRHNQASSTRVTGVHIDAQFYPMENGLPYTLT
jgi:hypothetical protein